MKVPTLLLLLATAFLTSLTGMAAEHKELKAFPQAKEGMKRIVIVLPHKERAEDDAFKVELIPGTMMETDGVNRMHVGLSIEPRPLKGWGYTFYEMTGKALGMTTLIGVPPGTPKVTKFVAGKPITIHYNSRLPIVLYIPKDHTVKYRIWKAGETQATKEG